MMTIEVEGVMLQLQKKDDFMHISKVIGRDRKVKADLLFTRKVSINDTMQVLAVMKKVARALCKRCTCDYGYGWSGHADHCESIYVAQEPNYGEDD